MATTEIHHHYEASPPEWIDVRSRDIGLALGIIGLAALTFAIGRATAPGASCCDDLLHRDMELVLCTTGLGLAGMDEAAEQQAVLDAQNAGQPNPMPPLVTDQWATGFTM